MSHHELDSPTSCHNTQTSHMGSPKSPVLSDLHFGIHPTSAYTYILHLCTMTVHLVPGHR